ncbi:GntR family transcriptional regulator [Subtercola lobariae]|uniref:GntR family transcriptional regulator n=1 Tax=Subtercola lobariae TaxID=1588641 RepID=A0A917BJP1_9MICO|nr:GntR family transcriptional regulator [Subtercola lobariae]GGF42066.1 GntR family transcriptional regulator [Subtercola lobariae]
MTMNARDVSTKKTQLSEDASTYVRNLIMAGELLPGASVRPEAIGEALDISATPAREALQVLRVEGFLELLPRRGFIVAPLTGDDIRDLFRANALIAGELAARAADVATPDDVAELEALHHELLAAASRRDFEALEEKNFRFHRQINHMAESRKLGWVLGVIERYVPSLFYASIEGWPAATADDHSTILESIRAQDAEGARVAMASHMAHAGELLAAQFDKRSAAPLA